MARCFSIVSVCPITGRYMFFATMNDAAIAKYFHVCLILRPAEDTIIVVNGEVFIITRTN